ncbi:MAG: L-ribulose-5-phosphate 4-epimerase AraD [Verrucomicrobiae bacterium]|nr:L-ribulose-5-phosphate 4-epimerase AraD [Verrucomicrobiae bacterium]
MKDKTVQELKTAVCEANLDLVKAGLVSQTFGNVSGIDRERGLVAIKPSGVDYTRLKPSHISVVSLMTGELVEGHLRPSSDTPTHLVLYRAFNAIGGIAHTHSTCATAWAQAAREIPVFGTTHADFFPGSVPCTRFLNTEEIASDYETATGNVIVERFSELDPLLVPGVLVVGHGPFTWGMNAHEAVQHAVALELIARLALETLSINPAAVPIPQALIDKHFSRKHGPGAYYGQKLTGRSTSVQPDTADQKPKTRRCQR